MLGWFRIPEAVSPLRRDCLHRGLCVPEMGPGAEQLTSCLVHLTNSCLRSCLPLVSKAAPQTNPLFVSWRFPCRALPERASRHGRTYISPAPPLSRPPTDRTAGSSGHDNVIQVTRTTVASAPLPLLTPTRPGDPAPAAGPERRGHPALATDEVARRHRALADTQAQRTGPLRVRTPFPAPHAQEEGRYVRGDHEFPRRLAP